MWLAICIISFLGIFVAIAGTVVMAIKRNPVWKKWLMSIGVCFVLFIVGAVNAPPSTPVSQQNTQKETVSVAPAVEKDTTAAKTTTDQTPGFSPEYNLELLYFNAKDYENTIEAFKSVQTNDPHYTDAQAKCEEAKDLFAQQLLSNAKAHLAKNEFTYATNNLNRALIFNPGLTEASNLIPVVQQKQQAFIEQQKQQEIADYKNSCQSLSYKVLNKNPDSLAGTKVKLYGKIMQIQESGNSTFMLLQITNKGYGIWTDNVAVAYDGKVNAYEDDIITCWGEVTGAYSYTSTAGWKLTVPGVRAKYF